ncbi:MAG: membrane protein insertase YidC, partial [Gammaproteobacteria bacterium]|nr:membrane protein insertase YidC [Gammaproteobacteria bacterium]
MDNLRLVLFFALAVILLLIWQAWQHDYGTASKPATTATLQQRVPASQETPTPPLPPGSASVTAPAPTPAMPRRVAGQAIHVVTDVLDAEINTVGGDLQKLSLRAYPAAVSEPRQPYPLLNDAPPYLFLAQTGLLAPSGAAPDHHAVYTAQKPDYRLAPGAQELQVPLRWAAPNGLQITKVYTFRRGSYVVNVDYQIRNASGQAWSGREYCQLLRTDQSNGQASHFVPIYNGAALYGQQDKYQKITYEDMRGKHLRRTLTGGWAAMVEHYFLGACIPDQKAQNYYYTNVLSDGRYVIGLVTPPVSVAPGGTADVGGRLYLGPKLQDHLAHVAP